MKSHGAFRYAIVAMIVATTGIVAFAQKPKVNTHDASVPHATKTTKSNLRKAGGEIRTGSRKAGKTISRASRSVQKSVNHAFRKKPS